MEMNIHSINESLLEDLFAALFTQHLPVIVTEPVDNSIHTNKPVTVM